MDQNSKVLTSNTKIAAYLVFIALLKEQGFHQILILLREIGQNLPDLLLHLHLRESIGGTHGRVWDGIRECIGSGNFPAGRTILLAQHVGANGIDEGSKPFRLFDAIFGYAAKHTGKGLLPNILDCSGTAQALTGLQTNQLAEVREKVLFRGEISGTKPLQVGPVEILKLHEHAVSPLRLLGVIGLYFPVYPLTRCFREKMDMFCKNLLRSRRAE